MAMSDAPQNGRSDDPGDLGPADTHVPASADQDPSGVDRDAQGPPLACPGCGREVTLLSNGFCGHCQAEAPVAGAPDVDNPDDWMRAAKAAVTKPYHPDEVGLYLCGDWLATKRGDRVILVRDGEVWDIESWDAEHLGVEPSVRGKTTVREGDITVEAWFVQAVRSDGGRNGPHPTTEPQGSDGQDGPVPRPVDARRAVVDAARRPGRVCVRGAYEAHRTTLETWGDRQDAEGVVLKLTSSGQRVAIVETTRLADLRDDLDLDADLSGQRVALPEDDFDVQDLFVDAASAVSLPGLGVQPGGDGDR